MFAQILYTQWKWTRTLLGAYVILAFILPAETLQTTAGRMNARIT